MTRLTVWCRPSADNTTWIYYLQQTLPLYDRFHEDIASHYVTYPLPFLHPSRFSCVQVAMKGIPLDLAQGSHCCSDCRCWRDHLVVPNLC